MDDTAISVVALLLWLESHSPIDNDYPSEVRLVLAGMHLAVRNIAAACASDNPFSVIDKVEKDISDLMMASELVRSGMSGDDISDILKGDDK